MFNNDISDIAIEFMINLFFGSFFIFYAKTGKNLLREILHIIFRT